LDGAALAWEDFQTSFNHHQSAELAQVVKQDKSVFEELDLGVVSRHGDVVDP
jgi:hypothetical protein